MILEDLRQSSCINGGGGIERCFIHLSSQETALHHSVKSTMAEVSDWNGVPDFTKKKFPLGQGQRIPYSHHLSYNTYSSSSTIKSLV